MSDRVGFECNGAPVEIGVAPGESLLSVLRERLGIVSAKDGCAPQGQCGCCTVIIDDRAVVACAVPAKNAAGKRVLTLEGFSELERDTFADSFIAAGGLQCGFCTPGIIVRAKHLLDKSPEPTDDQISSTVSVLACSSTS